MIWMWIGIIVAILGFAGVLVCAYLSKNNPNLQPLAIACAFVMLAGVGTYMYVYWNKDSIEAEANAKKMAVFDLAQMDQIGAKLKGQKIFLVTGSMESDSAKARLEALKNASGAEVVVVAPEGEMMEVDEKTFKSKVITPAAAGGVVLIDTDPMNFSKELDKAVKGNKIQFAFTANGSSAVKEAYAKNFGKNIKFAVIRKNVEEGFEPDDSKLEEAFKAQFEFVEQYSKDKFGEM